MKSCPSCGGRLKRIRYEGHPVYRCPDCRGYLLSDRRLDEIQRSPQRSVQELMDEARAELQPNTARSLSCPRCRAKMRKRRARQPASFTFDRCSYCRLTWLDGSELARLQLAYEISPKGQDAAEMRARLAEMEADPERRRQFEENLARLPEGDTTVVTGIDAIILGSLLNAGLDASDSLGDC